MNRGVTFLAGFVIAMSAAVVFAQDSTRPEAATAAPVAKHQGKKHNGAAPEQGAPGQQQGMPGCQMQGQMMPGMMQQMMGMPGMMPPMMGQMMMGMQGGMQGGQMPGMMPPPMMGMQQGMQGPMMGVMMQGRMPGMMMREEGMGHRMREGMFPMLAGIWGEGREQGMRPMMGGMQGPAMEEFDQKDMTKQGDEFLADIKKADSVLADKLEALRKDKPFEFRMAMMAADSPEMREGDKKDADNKEVVASLKAFLAEKEVRELAMKYRDGDGDKAALRKQIEADMAQVFDQRVASEENRAEETAKHASDMKDRAAKMKSEKDSLVKDRVDEMLGEKADW
jgi:hypothetical protein